MKKIRSDNDAQLEKLATIQMLDLATSSVGSDKHGYRREFCELLGRAETVAGAEVQPPAFELPGLARAIPNLAEVSIGHGLTADSLEFGMAGSVKRFLGALET